MPFSVIFVYIFEFEVNAVTACFFLLTLGKHHIGDKRMKSRIDPKRLIELEFLLAGSSFQNENKTTNTHDKREDTDFAVDENSSFQNSRVENDNSLFTYDEAIVSKSDLSTCVSNTSIREAWCDLPNRYLESGGCIAEFITKKQDRVVQYDEDIDTEFTEEELEMQRNIYLKLNRSYFPLGLNVMLERLPPFQKQYPMYNFACSKVFRRDQYAWHVHNIHLDIQESLNCNFTKRCPLYQNGCPYLQYLLKPKQGEVRFCRTFSCFMVSYDEITAIDDAKVAGDLTLLDLHYDILLYILNFLDNLSLNILAKTCHAFKSLCIDVLSRKGIVVPVWEKKSYADGGSSWKVEKNLQFFTTSISPVRYWIYTNNPCIGNHLLKCPFYDKRKMVDKIQLPMCGLTLDRAKILTNPATFSSGAV